MCCRSEHTFFFFKQSILSIDSLYTGISVSGSQLLKNLEGMKTQKCFKDLSEIESKLKKKKGMK